MSETPPDPADVHTGTDHVELTVCIPGQCCRGYCVDDTLHDLTKDQADRVRDVVAARLQALTAEDRTEPLQDALNATVAQRDAARAELAAANTELDRLAALKGRVDELAEYAERAQVAEATLDRVTALAESRDHDRLLSGTTMAYEIRTAIAGPPTHPRAALTPEGTE